MRWFFGAPDNTKIEGQIWAYFDVRNGYLYTGNNLSGSEQRPLDNTKLDTAKRYVIWLYKP